MPAPLTLNTYSYQGKQPGRPPAVFHRPPCFVFHYFQRPCVSLCFVFQNLGGAVKARVSCFVFQIFRACSAPAAPLASGGACGGLSPLRDENLLRAAWISPTRVNGRNFRRKPVLPRPHMYVWPPARVGQAGLYLQTASPPSGVSPGFGFRVSLFRGVWVSGFAHSAAGFRVSGFGFRLGGSA